MLSQKNISKKAFTLIETLIVIGIMSLISVGVIQQLQKHAEQQKAIAAGQRISEAGRALQNYVEANKIALLNAIPAGTTRVVDFCILNTFSPSDCDTSASDPALPIEPILPESFQNDSLFNTGYKIALKNIDNTDVVGLLYTDDSVHLDGSNEPRYDLLGAAAKVAGNAVGFADKSGNVIKGLNGSWEVNRIDNLLPDSMNWADQITPGILAYRTGAEDRFDDTYVRRDGSTELTGDLLLGNNNIKNINSITFDNYMVGQNGYLQNLRTQAIYNAGDIFSNTLNSQRTYTAELHTNKINTSDSSNQDLLIGADGNDKGTASGNLYIGSLTTNQNILAKQETAGLTLRATLQVAKDSSCVAYMPGSIATSNDGTGNVLSCRDGLWKPMGGGGGAPPKMYAFFDTASCPDGWVLANGSNGTRDMRGQFIRGVGGNAAARGVAQGDAIRNITGSKYLYGVESYGTASGALYQSGVFGGTWAGHSNKVSYSAIIGFDASRVVPTANENRPVNIALTACMKTE